MVLLGSGAVRDYAQRAGIVILAKAGIHLLRSPYGFRPSPE